MKRFILYAVMLAQGALAAGAAVSLPANAAGCLDRAKQMFVDANYVGCLDQLTLCGALSPDAAQMCELRYYEALASLHLDRDEALGLLRQFLAEYPSSPRRAYVQSLVGDWYFSRGKYPAALEAYSAVNPMVLTPVQCNGMSFRTGKAYLMLGENDTAASYFRSLSGDGEFGNRARYYLGYIAYSKKDYDLADQYFSSVDTSEPPCNATPYYQAQIAFAKGDYTKCLDMARTLLKDNTVPEFAPEANRLAGESLYNLGREQEAVPYLWKYCADDQKAAPSAYYILGISEFKAGDYNAAIKLLQQSVGTHSAMEQSAYLYLGQAYVKRGDNNSAMMAFENAYRVDYDKDVRETAFYNYAVARMDGGRVPFGNSVALLQDFLKEYPDSRYSADVERYVINGYMTDNDYEGALAAIAAIKNPSAEVMDAKRRVLLTLGSRACMAGKTAQAIDYLTEARSLSASDPSIRRQADLWLGDCYYSRGDYAKAKESYNAFLKAAPASEAANRAIALYDLAYADFSAEEYTAAAPAFQRAVDAISKANLPDGSQLTADAYSRIADCAYYARDFSQARSYYEKAYAANREAGDYALYQIAAMKGFEKDYAGKIADIDRLVASYPSSGLIPGALLEKAESQIALGRTADAITTYRTLVAGYPATASGRNGYLQLALTYINTGSRDKGIETYKTVIATYPTSEEARLASDDLKRIFAADGRLPEYAAFMKSVPDAPQTEPSELEALAFDAAESDYLTAGKTDKLQAYVKDYPKGRHKAKALKHLAEAAWNSGNASAAESLASQIVAGYPDSEAVEEAMVILGAAQTQLGKTDLARKTYTRLESSTSDVNMLREARLGMMRTSADLGDSKGVVQAADKLLSSTAAASSAESSEIRFMRARANDALGNTAVAYDDWTALGKNPSDIYGAKSLYYMGQSLFDKGDNAKAKATTEKLIESDSPHDYWLARGYILYSDILRKEGKTFEADEYLKSLKNNYPGTDADIFRMIQDRL